MATRIYPVRPLGRRRGYYGAQSNPAAAFSGGEQMGKMAGAAVEAWQKAAQQQKLDAMANKLMTPPNQPVDTLGTLGDEPLINQTLNPAFTGGVAGMKLQQEYIRNMLDNQRLAQEVRNQGIKSSMDARRGGGGGGGGGGGNASRWQQYLGGGGQSGQPGQKGKAGKPAAYQAGSSTIDTPDTYYNFDNQRKDLDSQYGNGTHNRLLGAYAALKGPNTVTDKNTGITTAYDQNPGTSDAPNTKAKPIVMVDKDGNVTLSPYGQHAGAYIPADEAKANMARYDGTLVKQGKEPRFSDQYLGTQHPESGISGGDPANPYTVKDNGQLDAIPPGKSYVDPTDNKVYTKQPPAKAAPPAKATSQADTGDQGQGLVGAQGDQGQGLAGAGLAGAQMGAGDQGQGLAGGPDNTGGQAPLPQVSPVTPQAPVDVASVTPANASPSFDLASPTTGGGLPQDTGLADEIQRSQLVTKLQGLYA